MEDYEDVRPPTPETISIPAISNGTTYTVHEPDQNDMTSSPTEGGNFRGPPYPGALTTSSEHIYERQTGPSPILEYLVTSRMHDMEERLRAQDDTIRSLRDEVVELRNEAARLNGTIVEGWAATMPRPMEVRAQSHGACNYYENSLLHCS